MTTYTTPGYDGAGHLLATVHDAETHAELSTISVPAADLPSIVATLRLIANGAAEPVLRDLARDALRSFTIEEATA